MPNRHATNIINKQSKHFFRHWFKGLVNRFENDSLKKD